MYIYSESLCYKLRKDFGINLETIESLSVKSSNKSSSNLIFNVIYRPPSGDIKVFEQFCKYISSKKNIKHMKFVGDFNMNVLDSEYNSKVKSFFDLMHQQNLIPTINNPTSRKKFSNGY